MNALPTSPAFLLIGVLLPLLAGAALMVWGRRLPRQGAWAAGVGLLALFIAACLGWSTLSQEGFAAQTWLRGWILPRDETGAITVGIVRDALGLSIATLVAIVSASLLIGAGEQARRHRLDRFYAALSLSSAGVALSWFAVTPWLALTGLAFSLLGGFLALGSQWAHPDEASFAARFGRERSSGLILSVVGLSILAGGRPQLTLLNPVTGGGWSAQAPSAASDLLGAGLLFVGALFQLQPFPFLGWVMKASDTATPSRITLSQVFPAWAVFAILLRLDPQFREVGVFPVFGWIGLVSALLASVAGLLHSQWRQSLSAWTSAAFSLSVAALAFAGPATALPLALGAGLGAAALAGFGSALEESSDSGEPSPKRAVWCKVGCALAASTGTGMIGFVTAGGSIRWLSFVVGQPGLAAASVLLFFLFATLGWKVAWSRISSKGSARATWGAVLAPYLLLLLGLGIVWTGTATGGAIIRNPDRLFASPFSFLIGPSAEAWGDESAFGLAATLHWGSLVLAMITAYWTAGKRVDFWPRFAASAPRLTAFVTSGYGVDAVFGRFGALVARVGEWSAWIIDDRLWATWIPGGIARGLQRGSDAIASADARLASWIGGALRRWVDAPAKALQVIQNGDVQWYLFFAVGSGIAILVHFMRT